MRSSDCAQTAPNAPVLAPTTATGAFRSGLVAIGREAQSSAFFSCPLTINDFEALTHLARAHEGRLKRVDLARSLLLTPSGVTRLLDGLEDTGLVAKESRSTDARVTHAALTDAGRIKLREAAASHIVAVAAVFESRFSPDELETLAELLGRLPGAAGATGEDCSAG